MCSLSFSPYGIMVASKASSRIDLVHLPVQVDVFCTQLMRDCVTGSRVGRKVQLGREVKKPHLVEVRVLVFPDFSMSTLVALVSARRH